MATLFAICSDPECTGSANALRFEALPEICAVCGAPMITTCWKCGAGVPEATAGYCRGCGVPLKRVLPRHAAAPLVLICGNPECDWASAGSSAGAMQTRCPQCGSTVTADCWKCGARISDPRQHYCAGCGVPLKRGRRPAASGLSGTGR